MNQEYINNLKEQIEQTTDDSRADLQQQLETLEGEAHV